MTQSYQTQPYEVVSTIDQIEIRYYPPAMKVQVKAQAVTIVISMHCFNIFLK